LSVNIEVVRVEFELEFGLSTLSKYVSGLLILFLTFFFLKIDFSEFLQL